MNCKVGLIIPSYNQGKYLEAAICSALANKKHVDMEIAVIDGGSQDESKDIIMRYSEKLDVWCSEPDGGQANAINKGIRLLPDCKYYMWLNSDDIYEDEYAIQKILIFAEQNQYEVCYGKSHFVDESGNIIGEYPVEEFSYDNLGKRCFLSQPSVLFSKKAYQATGVINELLKMCLDYEYWIRLAQRYRFGFLNEFIGSTRMYMETKTSTMKQRHLQEAITILMHYYERVSMQWLVEKMVLEHNNSIIRFIPRGALLIFLYPYRKYIIRNSIIGDLYD